MVSTLYPVTPSNTSLLIAARVSSYVKFSASPCLFNQQPRRTNKQQPDTNWCFLRLYTKQNQRSLIYRSVAALLNFCLQQKPFKVFPILKHVSVQRSAVVNSLHPFSLYRSSAARTRESSRIFWLWEPQQEPHSLQKNIVFLVWKLQLHAF